MHILPLPSAMAGALPYYPPPPPLFGMALPLSMAPPVRRVRLHFNTDAGLQSKLVTVPATLDELSSLCREKFGIDDNTELYLRWQEAEVDDVSILRDGDIVHVEIVQEGQSRRPLAGDKPPLPPMPLLSSIYPRLAMAMAPAPLWDLDTDTGKKRQRLCPKPLRHRRTLLELKRDYTCPEITCRRQYALENSLIVHIRSKHPELSEQIRKQPRGTLRWLRPQAPPADPDDGEATAGAESESADAGLAMGTPLGLDHDGSGFEQPTGLLPIGHHYHHHPHYPALAPLPSGGCGGAAGLGYAEHLYYTTGGALEAGMVEPYTPEAAGEEGGTPPRSSLDGAASLGGSLSASVSGEGDGDGETGTTEAEEAASAQLHHGGLEMMAHIPPLTADEYHTAAVPHAATLAFYEQMQEHLDAAALLPASAYAHALSIGGHPSAYAHAAYSGAFPSVYGHHAAHASFVHHPLPPLEGHHDPHSAETLLADADADALSDAAGGYGAALPPLSAHDVGDGDDEDAAVASAYAHTLGFDTVGIPVGPADHTLHLHFNAHTLPTHAHDAGLAHDTDLQHLGVADDHHILSLHE